MKPRLFLYLLVLLTGACPALEAATRTKVALWLDAETARPGDTVWAGVQLVMPRGYHTYWQYGGDSGGPTEVKWELPPGVKAGAIQWPVPEKYEEEGLFTYVYHGEAVLLIPLQLDKTIAPGPLDIKATVTWLECEKLCLPGETALGTKLTIGTEKKLSAQAASIEKARAFIPAAEGAKVTVKWGVSEGNARPLEIEWETGPDAREPEFFPLPEDAFDVAAATEINPAGAGKWLLRKQVTKKGPQWPAQIKGVLAATMPSGPPRAFAVTLKPGGVPATAAPPSASSGAGGWQWVVMLGAALLGGFILNFMPCVLPVISLKILGFVNQGQAHPREVRRLGMIYCAGVLASFLALAGLVLAARGAGKSVSWGMQLQDPVFVVVLMLVMTLIALNLFGIFEVMPGGRVLTAAGSLAAKEGASGAFFNGVLATFLATACTAPVLGAAVGFAFTQKNPLVIVPFFFVIGAGMALPYAVLTWNPGWLKYLPKPGAWMERFKQFMGFPMLATAIWLFSLGVEGLGQGSALWLGILLLVAALAAWLYGEFIQRAAKRSTWIWIILLAGAVAYILEGKLHWRNPPQTISTAGSDEIIQLHPNGIEWRRWSPEALAAARAQGRPVLVDFTASWCLTCQVNAKTSIEIPSVKAKLKEINAVALLEDSFKKNATVVAELAKHGRAGVPLVLIYPKDSSQPPMVLPEVLTPGLVLEALEKAGQ